MKRYYLDRLSRFAEMRENEDGEYVKAEVAQALYDALLYSMDDKSIAAKNIKEGSDDIHLIGVADMLDRSAEESRKALSLADGESE